jgi:phosphoglycolate phosphatase
VLFDIDGTLLSTRGAARRAFEKAMLGVYGTAGPIDTHGFNGKTDPQIARELLQLAGFADARIDAGLSQLWPSYLEGLGLELRRAEQQTVVYPGVTRLLTALERTNAALIGLLTGNLQEGATLKLESAGLADRFRLGAYGSDAERRDALPASAVRRAETLAGRRFAGEEVVIIGDTPHDISCGRSIGVRAIGVATGGHGVDELAACGAHHVFLDLSNTEAVLHSIF